MSMPCPRCGKNNDPLDLYCTSCMLPLSQKSVRRDLKILSTFRSPYMKVIGIDVDAVVDEFFNFRGLVMEMVKFRKAFNGGSQIDINLLRNELGWTKQKFDGLMRYLTETDIVKTDDNNVKIQTYIGPDGNQKSVFDNFLRFQEMYLSNK